MPRKEYPQKFRIRAPYWFPDASDSAWVSCGPNQTPAQGRVVRLGGRRAYSFKELVEKGWTWSADDGKTWNAFFIP